jgi:hypothetical protein
MRGAGPVVGEAAKYEVCAQLALTAMSVEANAIQTFNVSRLESAIAYYPLDTMRDRKRRAICMTIWGAK